jgi:outer membrane protein assembly factor BamB
VTAASAAPAAGAEPSRAAEEVVKASGLPGGFCVHLGVGDGELTAGLARGGKFLVHGLVTDRARLTRVRARLRSRKLGGRASAHFAAPSRLPYADDLVNLLVVSDLPAMVEKGLAAREVARVLAPGGAVCLGGEVDRAWLRAAGLSEGRKSGAWTVARRPRPREMDEWRHYRHDPLRTATSADALVGPPRRMRWIDGPRRSRNHRTHPMGVVTAAGRIFYVFDHGEAYYEEPLRVEVVARDAFSGVVLWRKPVKARIVGERHDLDYPEKALAATAERVYVSLSRTGPLVALEARTGRLIHTYEGTRPKATILLGEDLLILESGRALRVAGKDGEVRWSRKLDGGAEDLIVSAGAVCVHIPDRNALVCLNLADGKQRWRTTEEGLGEGTSLVGATDRRLIHCRPSLLRGYSLRDGSRTWRYGYNMVRRRETVNVFLSAGLVWAHCTGKGGKPQAWVGVDPRTGEERRRLPVRITNKCAPCVATGRYLISGRLDFTDIKTGKTKNTKASRAACRFTAIPANGMIYTFPTDCHCFPHLKGIMGLGPAPRAEVAPAERPAHPLERGPAFGPVQNPKSEIQNGEDWPTYRRDAVRSGCSPTVVPAELSEIWAAEIGGRLTPPTVAGGTVFLASVDDWCAHALRASDGKRLWSFAAEGRVSTPLTWWRGRVFFGCHDGWVYSLRASDGKLVWKFRAAPQERRVMAYGRLESAWPVRGSPPVVDGSLYVAAGRHSGLDGGIHIFGLDAESGKVVWTAQPTRTAYADLLVRRGSWLRMHRAAFDLESGKVPARGTRLPRTLSSGCSSPFWDSSYGYRPQWRIGRDFMGQILCFDKKRVLGFHGRLDEGKYSITAPGRGHYRLFMRNAADRSEAWRKTLPVKPAALVLTARSAFVAGARDAWPAKTSMLLGYAAKDGEEIARLKIPSRPVFDGMAAAGGRLYVSTADGKLRCFGKK